MTAESKGTVEALFTWVTRKFSHRLPGTTKATPTDRGAYDSGAEAQKAGITLDILEKLFIQSIVDAYLQEWDHLRRGRRISLWEDSVREKGVPNYLGSPDDLKLLLMKGRQSQEPGHRALRDFSLPWAVFLGISLCQSWVAGSATRQGNRYLLR